LSTPSSQLCKVTVHKGRTFNMGQFQSLRLDYSFEDTIDRDRRLYAVRLAEAQIDGLLDEQAAKLTKTSTPTQTPASKPAVTTPTQPAVSSSIDSYGSLPWRQSQKKPNLSTILVTSELPDLARALYNALCKAFDNALQTNAATYKLSRTDTAEFLQRWAKPTT